MPDTKGKTPQLVLFPEAEDHWAGITDPRERRRIQNRLAQRAYRIRNSRKGNLRIKFFRPLTGTDNSGGEAPTSKWEFHAVAPLPRKIGSGKIPVTEIDTAPKLALEGVNSFTPGEAYSSKVVIGNEEQEIDLQWPVFTQVSIGGVSTDHEFINLIYYNVFRAFQVNIGSLGLTTYLLCLDILSPFNEISLGGTVSDDLEGTVLTVPKPDLVSNLPPALKPTALQISVLHHPWIDLFPCPKLRDNLLCAGDALDTWGICQDVCQGGGNGASGLIVWGDPWDTSGWEVTEPLARKWPWMLEGCDEVMEGTNYWRALRGLESLSLYPGV